MPKKKLTEKLRAHIKANYHKLKQSDYEGEALRYLKQVRSAAHARHVTRESTLKVGDYKVPKNSELYRKIEAAASMKGQTVRQFMASKKNTKAVELLVRDGGVTVIRETEYLISDIKALPKRAKVYWNMQEVSRLYAIALLTEIASLSVQYSNVVVINWEVRYDLLGNLYITQVPDRDDLDEAIEEIDAYPEDEDRADFWAAFLDQYNNLNYIRS